MSKFSRIKALEREREDEIPCPHDLIGEYYDELESDFDKLRVWLYYYGGNRFDFSLDDFERMDVPTFHESLHFIIEPLPNCIFDFPELDEWQADLDRMFRENGM